MANYENELYELGQVLGALSTENLQDKSEKEQREILQWLNVGAGYYHNFFKLLKKLNKNGTVYSTILVEDPNVNGRNLKELVGAKPYEENIYRFYSWLTSRDEEKKVAPKKKEEEEKEEENEDNIPNEEEEEKEDETPVKKAEEKPTEKVAPPAKEASSVPAELETLVAIYKESQADKLEADSTHSVTDDVKRARKTWEERNRIETILKNRTDIQKEEAERFIANSINPKYNKLQEVESNSRNLAKKSITAQLTNLGLDPKEDISTIQLNRAIEDLVYLGLTGSVDLTNLRALNTASQLALRNQGFTVDASIIQIDDRVQELRKTLDEQPYSDTSDNLEEQINAEEEKAKEHLDKTTESFSKILSKENPDLDIYLEETAKELAKIQTNLLKVAPNAVLPSGKVTPLEKHGASLERELRRFDPSLRINTEGMAARVSEVLAITKSQTNKISKESVYFYGIGLTYQKMEGALTFAKANPDSELGKLLLSNGRPTDVYSQVHSQLFKLANSVQGKEIEKGLTKLSGISGTVTGIYNRLPAGAQSATKLILDPGGTVRTWVNRKIGQRIGTELVKQTGSVLSQKLGNYLLKEGLEQGIKTFAKKAAGKLALEAAKKIGVAVVGDSLVATLAVALGIPTAGVSIIIGAILIVGQIVIDATLGFVKKRMNELYGALGWGEFHWRDLAVPVVVGGAAVATAGVTFISGMRLAFFATRVAAVSAVGIIVASLITVALYLTMVYLTAPILSTIVQLDSVEKVDYPEPETLYTPSGDCSWPTSGRHAVTTGPRGGTHSRSQLEAIDLYSAGINGTPHLSGTSGTVKYTGTYSNYGNTVIIRTTNNAGSFDAIYGHLSSISVRVGQQVNQGQRIGSVGGSGGWSPHIHMEYKGIKYNQCPAGGLVIKEGCCNYGCASNCNAFSN